MPEHRLTQDDGLDAGFLGEFADHRFARAETAVAILERKIAATPDHLQRDQGHQFAKLANAVLATSQPDPERAVDLGLRCASTAKHTGSARITKELRTLDRTLAAQWPNLPGTAELHEALAY